MKSRLFILAIALLAAVPALATNGYFLHGIGTGSKSMAGATTAFPLEALDADTNPAAGVFVNRGYSFSLAFFNPDRQYTVTGNPSGMPQTSGPATVCRTARLGNRTTELLIRSTPTIWCAGVSPLGSRPTSSVRSIRCPRRLRACRIWFPAATPAPPARTISRT